MNRKKCERRLDFSVGTAPEWSGAAAQLNVADILYTGFACAEYEQSVRQLARTHIEKPAP